METINLRWVNGWSWLKKPKVQRLVCLASSVVGLICYALSSTFNHLLGNWIWWKMLLYIVFSFIICLAVWFAPARSSSTSLRLEVHLAFLVLIVTSVYSFLFDNVVKGKADAYSLISCAAFATMSLGLSNLTQLGFQIDLLYFFCGSLIVQLMKIKLWLVIVGGGFSYSLLQLRYYPRDTLGENLQLQVQNQVIIQVDDLESHMSQEADADVDSTLGTSPEDGDLLIQSNSHPQNDDLIIQEQLMNCIKELEKENQMVVPMVCSHVEKYLKAMFNSKDKVEEQNEMREVPHPDVNLVMDAYPSGIRRRLKESVKLMVEAGLEEECIEIYSKWRREFLQQCLRALGLQFQTPNNEDVEKWFKTCRAAGKILFPNERIFCDYLFSGFSDAAGVSYDNVCKEVVIGLLSFVDTIITTTFYQPNLLFNILPKMLDSLDELISELNPLSFRKMSFEDDLEDVSQRLVIVHGFMKIIYPNNVHAPVTDGGLHMTTKEAMNYFLIISEDYRKWRVVQSDHIENSTFRVLIGRMIELLESELEAKSKVYYTDPALSYVFMINNLSYIGQKMPDFKFDDDWFGQNTAKVEENCNLYLRSSWNKLLDFLKLERNESMELMKDKLHLFNLHFEETCTIQSTWTVSDKLQRERIVKSIEALLLPEYGNFTDRFRAVFGNQAYDYIKFGIVDIQNCLSHLFLPDQEMDLQQLKKIMENDRSLKLTEGGLHLITKEAMNYILKTCGDNRERMVGQSDHIENSIFWVQIARMIEFLENELEAKSKDYYTDPALGYIFMINNLIYIGQKMHYLKFDDDWFGQNTAKVEENCNLYLRSSWNKLLDFLKLETNESAEQDLTAELMKDKLHLFNLHFEETCTLQSTWTVFDKRQRERIVKSIEAFLLPEYGIFSDRFRAVFGNQAYDYIKFGIVDIQNCLSHLFLLDEEMDLQDEK